jgi:hypothetical protein
MLPERIEKKIPHPYPNTRSTSRVNPMKIAAVLMSAMAWDRAGPTPRSSRRPKMPHKDAASPTTASNSGRAMSINLVTAISLPGVTS